MKAARLVEDWSRHEPSPLAAEAARIAASGGRVIDLATANPHDHGLVFPAERLEALETRARQGGWRYAPDPAGRREAREAVARWHARRGCVLDAGRIVLSPGTSLAYFLAFRLLAGTGDNVLVPRPSYPLFDDLATLAGVATRNYHLTRGADRWCLDPEEVAFQVTPRTRAVVVVSPHNPCGHTCTAEEWAGLAAVCRAHGLALLVDEVFRAFPQSDRPMPAAMEERFGFPLVLTLNGFSKMYSLPGHKAAWIAVTGGHEAAERAWTALCYAMDSLLPVAETTQALMPLVLDGCDDVSDALAAEYCARMRVLAGVLPARDGWPAPEAGVYRLAGLGADCEAEAVALELLRREHVLTHPGGLYGVDDPCLVMTAVPEPDALREGVGRIAASLRRR